MARRMLGLRVCNNLASLVEFGHRSSGYGYDCPEPDRGRERRHVEFRQGLTIGSIVGGDYRIDGVLGQGGFGLTYKGFDTRLGSSVAIKEYFPADMAVREDGTSVHVRSSREEGVFAWGREKFLEEARTLARFRHNNIVRVARLFEENNTAYMVLDFVEGETVERWARRNGAPPVEMLRSIVGRVLDALEAIHLAKVWHRDISPDNIMLRLNGDPVLIDFGAAKTELSTRTTTYAIVRKEYSPIEQVAVTDASLQGPWTDIYALAATLYRLVTGRVPVPSTDRLLDKLMDPASVVAAGRYPDALLQAIDWGLNLKARERPQSVSEWRQRLLDDGQFGRHPGHDTGLDSQRPPPVDDKTELATDEPTTSEPNRRRWAWNPFDRGQQGGANDDKTVAADDSLPSSIPSDLAIADKAAWEAAAAIGSLAALRGYMTSNPAGTMLAEAERRIGARLQNRQIRAFTGHVGPVYAVTLSADGQSALSAGSDMMIRQWSTTNGEEIAALKGHTRPVRHVAFLPDARFAVSAGDDRSARLWSLEQGNQVRAFDRHDSEVLSLAVTADGLGIVTGTRFRSVMRWDLNSGRAMSEFGDHNGPVTAIATTATGQYAVTGGQDRLLRLHAMPGLGLVRPLGQLPDGILSIAISPDGEKAAVACGDGAVYTWDLRATSGPDPRPAPPRQTLRGHDGAVRSVAFIADGRIILSGGRDGTLRLWHADTGQPLLVIAAHRDQIHAVASGPQQGFVATAGADGHVRLWDISDHAPPR